jgi:hypothetical protein
MEGFCSLGHQARYIGVRSHDNQDLATCIRTVGDDDDLVIFEYEPGIFWLGGLIRAVAWLRFWHRKQILLSVHEIAVDKYPEFHRIQRHLDRPISYRGLFGMGRILASTIDVALRFLLLRGALLVMGWLPHGIVVHSPKAAENIHLAWPNDRKIHYVPLMVKYIDGDRDTQREQLSLPREVFAFIVPGFLFRRKRIIEVIKQLPTETELWIVGTASEHDPGYLEEIEAFLSQSDIQERVRIIQDYERMEQYLMASDVVVLFYNDAYQSGIASLAVGSAKPCIFSDLPAFTDLREAGLTVRTPLELHQAMIRIQESNCYQQLVKDAHRLRKKLSPKQIAERYLEV